MNLISTCSLVFIAVTLSLYLHDLRSVQEEQKAALQQIAAQGTEQNAELDASQERDQEIFEHLAGVTKRGKK